MNKCNCVLTIIFFAILIQGCIVRDSSNHLDFTVPTNELIDSLRVTQRFLNNFKSDDVKNYFWDSENNLFVNSKKIGYLNDDRDLIIFDRNDSSSYIRLIPLFLYLKKQNIYGGYVHYKTKYTFFDYSLKRKYEAEEIRKIFLADKISDKTLEFVDYVVVDKKPPLYLLKVKD